jgi:hypothetical protein
MGRSRKPRWMKQLSGTDQPCRRGPGEDDRPGLSVLADVQAGFESATRRSISAEASRAAAREALELARRLRGRPERRRRLLKKHRDT